MKNVLALLLLPAAILAAPALCQIIPKDAATPVEVIKGRGDLAQKLQGTVMPTGKGWKGAMDAQRRLQIMVPDKWKVETPALGDAVIRAVPSGEKDPSTVLLVMVSAPRDADPIDVDQEFATNYADDLAQEPAYKKLHLTTTDSGLILNRGMKFALGAWTMPTGSKEPLRQAQLVYISEDRIVTIQFIAHQKEFDRHLSELAQIFASYQTLGRVKTSDE